MIKNILYLLIAAFPCVLYATSPIKTPQFNSGITSFEIIQNQDYPAGLLLENKENLIIRNCTVTNPNGEFGIKLINCENVLIENCHIRNVNNEENIFLEKRKGSYDKDFIFCNFLYHGIYLNDCRKVKISKCEILDAMGQGIRVHGKNNTTTYGVTIDSCRIAYIYDDGIKFSVDKDQEPAVNHPFKGAIITNNMVHDIGLGCSRLPFARHGMYLKTVDVVVENNTIYNCFYGSGISLRNSGVIRNNKIWNCLYACIAYHKQTFTNEGSREVYIENNECRQDFAYDIPMRHVGNPNGPFNGCAKGTMYINIDREGAGSMFFIEKYVVRNNKCLLYKDYPASMKGKNIPMIYFGGKLSDATMIVENNILEDQREEAYYIQGLAVDSNNTLK